MTASGASVPMFPETMYVAGISLSGYRSLKKYIVIDVRRIKLVVCAWG
jgi:hypothetical protein